MLQKKLHELESELIDVFRLPLDPTASDPRHKMSFDDIEQRFILLNKILSLEVASQPQTSDQLHEVGQRLAGLMAAFRDWKVSRTCAFNNHEDALSICSDCTQALLYDDFRESGSLISEADNFSGEKSPEKFLDSVETDENVKKEDFTQALLYHDVRESGSPISEAENVSGKESPEKLLDSVERDENLKKEEVAEERICSKMGKYGGVFGCGMVFGAICMVKLFFSSDHFIQYEALLLPPT
ncbi:hypothetical protein Pfo_014954 [Paulownia fortunei]|nr:hypothetical protein Pfo_014954 [Paulownia fortunei]